MPDLNLSDVRDRARPAAPGRPAASGRLAPVRAAVRRAAAQASPRSVWRSHRLFAILVLIALVPRILAELAFRPALLTADSFLYMQGAVTGNLGMIRPSGYSLFLAPFQGLPHALLLVTSVQHLIGIGVAVIVYGLLRSEGLPAWGASLAAVPVLLDAREVALESYILPDTVFCLVLMITVALLIRRQAPSLGQCVAAGLLLAYISVLRGNGIPLAVVVFAFLLIRKVGWRSLAAAAASFALPVLAYVTLFHAQNGQFNLTSSDGLFLWSRTTSFASCAVIKPPRDLAPLCPDRQRQIRTPARAPAWSVHYLLNQPAPADYLWAPGVWWRHDAHPGVNSANNKLGERFAIDAIKAQPLDYLRVVARDVMLTFLATDRPLTHATMSFTTAPHIAVLPSYYVKDLRQFAGTASNTHPVYPYAFFLFLYQQPVIFAGLLFLLVVLAGAVGVIRNWRGAHSLPWALAVVSIVSPALLTQSLYRYAMVAIPLSCLAAGLAFARRPGRALAVAQTAGDEPGAVRGPAAEPAAPRPADQPSGQPAPEARLAGPEARLAAPEPRPPGVLP